MHFLSIFALLASTLLLLAAASPHPDQHLDIDSDPWWQSVSSPHLEKRRGGGGLGGGSSGGGRSGGGRSGGSSSSPGRTSGYGSFFSSGRRPRLTSRTRSSNAGGSTKAGSGTPRNFGGSRTYAGGSSVPYTSGQRSSSGIAPLLLGAGALSILPGLWLAGAYAYPYAHSHTFMNRTSGMNESLPVLCLCQEYSVCGCDENGNSTYTQALYDNATSAEAGKAVVARVVEVNGTRTLVVNGTLENGTTAEGGTENGAGRVVGGWVSVVGLAGMVGLMLA